MKKIILFAVIFLSGCMLYAQDDIKSILNTIDDNNTELKALRAEVESETLSYEMAATLQDPEVEFSYLWGSPSSIGARQDVSVSQTFDFGTLTGNRRRVSDGKSRMAAEKYRSERMSVLLEAKCTLLEWIYYNQLSQEYARQMDLMQEVLDAYSQKLAQGTCTSVEYNNIFLEYSKMKADLAETTAQMESRLGELKRLNGGLDIDIAVKGYESISLPLNYNDWIEDAASKSPAMAYVKSEMEVRNAELSLSRNQNMPSVSVGYMGEYVVGQKYQGISFGLSIPIWSSGRRVKQARASLQASQLREKDVKEQFYQSLKSGYAYVSRLAQVVDIYDNALSSADNDLLLSKSLDQGAISVTDYLVGLERYNTVMLERLAAERDYQLAYASLMAFEL